MKMYVMLLLSFKINTETKRTSGESGVCNCRNFRLCCSYCAPGGASEQRGHHLGAPWNWRISGSAQSPESESASTRGPQRSEGMLKWDVRRDRYLLASVSQRCLAIAMGFFFLNFQLHLTFNIVLY